MTYNLIGKRFGKLVVIKKLDEKYKNGNMWECICDCGNSTKTYTSILNSGHKKSCGCLRPGKNSPLSFLFYYTKSKAKYRGLAFLLDKSYFETLIKSNCYYCGKPPSNKAEKYGTFVLYSGIDRIDNNRGYIKDNCVPCCKECNNKKKDITIDMIRKIVEYLDKIPNSI